MPATLDGNTPDSLLITVYSASGSSHVGYTGGLRLMSLGRLFLGRRSAAFLAPFLRGCVAASSNPGEAWMPGERKERR